MSNDTLDSSLISAYERLHKDYLYLENKYQHLYAQKEEMACTLMDKDIKIWRMQIENERCKAEIERLQKNIRNK